MSSSVLHPPAHLSPAVALQLSQHAPVILKNTPHSTSAYSLSSLWSAPESAELWTTYENLLMSCLRTGDQQSAHKCLERLTERFGADNERVMALRGLYQEATAHDEAGLELILKEYNTIIEHESSNIPILKRRIALLKSMGRISDAIKALTSFLDASPTDAEAWAEISDLYAGEGLYQQAIFALEEVMLITPNAWNMQARLGEVLYIAATAEPSAADKYLAESIRRFSRSIELCDDFLRGYYGLKLSTSRLMSNNPKGNKKQKDDDLDLPLPDIKTLERLNQLATAKLAEIVRRGVAREAGWEGYDSAELIAAQALLDLDTTPKTR